MSSLALMYLAGNTRPDTAYEVHQAAWFTHGARKSHAAGVKRFLHYLKKTKSEGMILKPGKDHRVDCYVDADFGGLFSTEDKHDPVSVKFRTRYVIPYRGARLMWASKMQTQVALSSSSHWASRCEILFQFEKSWRRSWPSFLRRLHPSHITRVWSFRWHYRNSFSCHPTTMHAEILLACPNWHPEQSTLVGSHIIGFVVERLEIQIESIDMTD